MFYFSVESLEVRTMQSKFLMCYFSTRAILVKGSSWACAMTQVFRTVLISTFGQTNKTLFKPSHRLFSLAGRAPAQ